MNKLILFSFLFVLNGQSVIPVRQTNRIYPSVKPWTVGPNLTHGARPVYGFHGQSNVDGVIPIANLEAEYQGTYAGVKFYKQLTTLNRVELASMNSADETTYKAGNPNPGGYFTFQFYLYPWLNTQSGKQATILHHAYGGTSLATDWKSRTTKGTLYVETIFKYNALIKEITNADGMAPSVRFILFGQGENDAKNLTDANNYQTNLTNFINDFRTDIGLPTVPFLIMRLNSSIANSAVSPGPYPYWATVRTAQENVASGSTGVSNVYIVNQDNATMAADWIHYTISGYHTIDTNLRAVITTNNLLP